MSQASNPGEVTFVFEVCSNCSSHSWNTRHNEVKYQQFFADVSSAIRELIPLANCVMNKVPKPWYEQEIYCQLINNEEDDNPHYDFVPRIGAFEVSTCYGNTGILFFSKQMSGVWPHARSLAKRAKAYYDDMLKEEDGMTLKEKYYTSGITKVVQQNSPRSPRGAREGTSSMRETGGNFGFSASSQGSAFPKGTATRESGAFEREIAEQPSREDEKVEEEAPKISQPAPPKVETPPPEREQTPEPAAKPEDEKVEAQPAADEVAEPSPAPKEEAPKVELDEGMLEMRQTMREQATKIFEKCDVNKDGAITQNEMREGLINEPDCNLLPSSYGTIEEQVNQIFGTMDEDNNNKLSLEEIITFVDRFIECVASDLQ